MIPSLKLENSKLNLVSAFIRFNWPGRNFAKIWVSGCAVTGRLSRTACPCTPSECPMSYPWDFPLPSRSYLLLRATSCDIRASFFSQPIVLPDLREELKKQVNRSHPQLIFSLGMAKPMRPSPRRPIEDVID